MMFHTFPDLLAQMEVFNPWNSAYDELSRRVKSIERKLYNAMFFIERAEEYPRSLTADGHAGVEEMRALDAYCDGSMGELHGALDMLASAISFKYGVTNTRGGSYSFAQMFRSDKIEPKIAEAVGDAAARILLEIKTDSHNLIYKNNIAKHSEMGETLLYPYDYPDYLEEPSKIFFQKITGSDQIQDIRKTVSDLRGLANVIGKRICDLIGYFTKDGMWMKDDKRAATTALNPTFSTDHLG